VNVTDSVIRYERTFSSRIGSVKKDYPKELGAMCQVMRKTPEIVSILACFWTPLLSLKTQEILLLKAARTNSSSPPYTLNRQQLFDDCRHV
jgi:hypothetical protein